MNFPVEFLSFSQTSMEFQYSDADTQNKKEKIIKEKKLGFPFSDGPQPGLDSFSILFFELKSTFYAMWEGQYSPAHYEK